MLRAVITDLDGTFLGADSQPLAANMDALRRAAATGCHIMVATGRHYPFVQALLQQLGVPAWVLSANGARVHAPDGSLFAAANLAPALVQKLVQPELAMGAEMALYLDDRRLACRYHGGGLDWYAQAAEQLDSLADYHGRDVAKIVYCGEPALLARIEADILYRFEGQLALTYSQDCYLEAMAPGVSKGSALLSVLQQLDIDPADCAAFGDALNDAEMLSLVGHPHVMANASAALRQRVPQALVIGHHTEAAVAQALARWFA